MQGGGLEAARAPQVYRKVSAQFHREESEKGHEEHVGKASRIKMELHSFLGIFDCDKINCSYHFVFS